MEVATFGYRSVYGFTHARPPTPGNFTGLKKAADGGRSSAASHGHFFQIPRTMVQNGDNRAPSRNFFKKSFREAPHERAGARRCSSGIDLAAQTSIQFGDAAHPLVTGLARALE